MTATSTATTIVTTTVTRFTSGSTSALPWFEYFDLETVWQTATSDVPVLRPLLESLRKN